MAKQHLGFSVAFVLWLSALTLVASAALAEDFRGKVVGVSAGDTMSVLRDGRAETVRLNGIDAPEKGQAFGNRAKQFSPRSPSGRSSPCGPRSGIGTGGSLRT